MTCGLAVPHLSGRASEGSNLCRLLENMKKKEGKRWTFRLRLA